MRSRASLTRIFFFKERALQQATTTATERQQLTGGLEDKLTKRRQATAKTEGDQKTTRPRERKD